MEATVNEVPLNIIRRWPEGFADRLEHVWKDLIGFVPNYKLYDLQRALAEFGFTMKVWEGPDPLQGMSPVNRLISYSASAKLRELGYVWDDKAEEWRRS